jgi:LacI family transcriptional regulator
MDVQRIARMVEKIEADAWVVVEGPHEVLEWFAERDTPAFAMYGRRRGLSITGAWPDMPPAIVVATNALMGLGHRRIVLLTRKLRRFPEPGLGEQAFLDELAASGISPTPYHLPDWKDSVDGLHERLESLFRLTPPTALVIDGVALFVAALEFCASRGLRVPQDVSLVSTDHDPVFKLCRPAVAHIRWNSSPLVRRVVQWAANVSRGKKDIRQTLIPAEFVPGGTIGPAKK